MASVEGCMLEAPTFQFFNSGISRGCQVQRNVQRHHASLLSEDFLLLSQIFKIAKASLNPENIRPEEVEGQNHAIVLLPR